VSWPQVTCTENLVKFGRVFEIRQQTENKHTNMMIKMLYTPNIYSM